MTKKILAMALVVAAVAQNTAPEARPRASGLGLKVGILPTGPLDAITDEVWICIALDSNPDHHRSDRC